MFITQYFELRIYIWLCSMIIWRGYLEMFYLVVVEMLWIVQLRCIEKFVYLYNLNNNFFFLKKIISYLKLGLFTKLYRLLEVRWGGAPRRARLSLMGPYGGRQSLSGGLPSPWEYNDGPHPPKHETWDKAKWWICLFGCYAACCYFS